MFLYDYPDEKWVDVSTNNDVLKMYMKCHIVLLISTTIQGLYVPFNKPYYSE
jgi:hypothetical protein